MSRPFVISVVNSKGGVAKTCTAVNLSASIAGSVAKGLKVLLVDQDPQMNATGLLLDPDRLPSRDESLWRVYDDSSYNGDGQELFHETRIGGLYVLPSSLMLEGVELRSAKLENAQLRLRNFIRANCDSFDIVIIDNGPSVNIFSINSLLASTHYLLATSPEKLSIDGIDRFEGTAVEFARRFNPDLARLGIVINMVHRDRDQYSEGLKALPEEAILSRIHDSNIMRASCSSNKTVLEMAPSSELQRELELLAFNVLSRLGLHGTLPDHAEKSSVNVLSRFLKFWRRPR